MRVPIPSDWDGQTWQCIQIQWPKSTQWEAILTGLLTYAMRGRFWDERTGSIHAAQAVAWDIFERNRNFTPCAECPETPSGQDGAIGGGALIESEGTSMGQVVTDVTVENGVLTVWFGPCCSKPLSDFVVTAVTPDIGEEPLVPQGGTPPAYSACGKAIAIVRAIKLVIQAAFDAATEVDWPWQILGHIEQKVGYNLSDKWMASIYLDTTAATGLGRDAEDIYSITDMQLSICNLVHVFSNDNLGVPDEATYDALKAAIHTRNFLYDGIIMTAVACLGRGNLDTIAKLGAADDGNCDCDGGLLDDPTQPDVNGWYASDNLAGLFESVEETGTWAIANYVAALAEDAYGTVMRVTTTQTSDTIKRMDSDTSDPSYTPPTHDIDAWVNSSDHLETANQSIPHISTLTAEIRTSIAAQLGYPANIDGGNGGINGTTIGTPPATAGQIVAASIWSELPSLLASGFAVEEFRFVYNVNSPSHA